MMLVSLGARRAECRLRGSARGVLVVLIGVLVAPGTPSLLAQRPAPPKGWAIDTTGVRPTATRKGGMMSSDSRAEVLGPMAWTGASVSDWLRTFASDNAGSLGVLIPPTGNPVSTSTIAGRQVVVAAFSVTVPTGTLYVAYSIAAETAPGTPAVLIRSTFSDPLTMVRAFRTSVEAVLPYVLTLTPQMRALAVAAAPRAVPTSFRAPAVDPDPLRPVSGSTASVADSSVASAVRTGVSDAIALLANDSAGVAPPDSAHVRPAPQSASRAQARPPDRTSVRPPTSRTAPVSEANVDMIVFYQWGDLQYHPVALFKDGTAFDLDDEAIDLIDVANSRASHPGKWGRWRRAGSQFFLRDGSTGRESDWTLGNGFHPAFPAPPGGTLTGLYKSVSGSTMGEMSTLLTSTLRFHPDGRFTSGTDFAATGSGDVSGVSMAGGASRSTAGRYLVKQFHIELIYDSGQRTSYFFGYGSSGAPPQIDRGMIFIGDTAYVLETP